MAYRHLHGIGVPKSCQAAVLYYNQPAEKVVNMVQVPGLSPNVEKVRLTTDEENGASARREREVAARALGMMVAVALINTTVVEVVVLEHLQQADFGPMNQPTDRMVEMG